MILKAGFGICGKSPKFTGTVKYHRISNVLVLPQKPIWGSANYTLRTKECIISVYFKND